MSMKREVISRTIAGVLATLIVAGIWYFWAWVRPFVMVTIPALVAACWESLSNLAAWLAGPVGVPRWWYGILLLMPVAVAWRYCALWWRRYNTPSEPSYRDFTEFVRWKIVWRWHWHGREPVGIAGFCPKCDRHIRYTEDIRILSPDPTLLSCNNCPEVHVYLEGKHRQIINNVSLEIDHAVRSGEWRDRLVS